MDKYCNDDYCVSICDFCKHYKDYSEEKHKLNEGFIGVGTCLKKNIEVEASDSCDNDFESKYQKGEVNE